MTNNQEEFFPITNEDGNITGSIMKNEIHDGSKMLHPIVRLHVFIPSPAIDLLTKPKPYPTNNLVVGYGF